MANNASDLKRDHCLRWLTNTLQKATKPHDKVVICWKITGSNDALRCVVLLCSSYNACQFFYTLAFDFNNSECVREFVF